MAFRLWLACLYCGDACVNYRPEFDSGIGRGYRRFLRARCVVLSYGWIMNQKMRMRACFLCCWLGWVEGSRRFWWFGLRRRRRFRLWSGVCRSCPCTRCRLSICSRWMTARVGFWSWCWLGSCWCPICIWIGFCRARFCPWGWRSLKIKIGEFSFVDFRIGFGIWGQGFIMNYFCWKKFKIIKMIKYYIKTFLYQKIGFLKHILIYKDCV